MSTKTSIKRVALVAVAALGFGMLSAVSSTADTRQTPITDDNGAEYITSIAATTNYAPVAGSTGTTVTHTVYFKSSTATQITINPSVVLAAKPASSTLAEEGSYASGNPGAAEWKFVTSSLGSTQTMAASRQNSAASAAINGTYSYNVQYLDVRYDLAGTYKWTFWNDVNADGRVNGSEYSYTHTVVVGSETSAAVLTGTLTPFNATSAEDGTYGSLIKVTLTDASGNAANVDTAGGVKVTVSGSGKVSAVNTTDVSDSSTYVLGATDFNGSGNAWINVTDATAETVVVSLSGTGSNGQFVAGASKSIVFKAIAGTKTTAAATTTTTTNDADEHVMITAGVASTAYFKTAQTTASTYDVVLVTDSTLGAITGKGSAAYDLAVLGDDTSGATNPGSFSITATFTAASQTYTYKVGTGSSVTVTARAQSLDDFTIASPSTSSWRSAAAGKQTVTVEAVDQFGGAMSNVSITPSIAGRNSTLTLSTIVTDAAGQATFSYTDASTSTTSLVDTITFTSGSETESVTVTYSSAANLGASTVSLVTPSETTAGTVNDPIVNSAIKAGDGAEAGKVAVTATVKDKDGVVLSGVPVTFTVSGTGAAITSTTKTVYTGATGTATAYLYAWLAGTYTVTATAGSVSDTAVSSWSQENGDYSRTVSVAATGNSVVATVKDRFGNPVKGVELTATRVGTGSFGGASSIKGTTNAAGQVEFILTGGTGTVTVAFSSATFGQSDALKGLVSSSTSTDVFTAYTAGDALTDEEGVGASYDAAGINSASAEATDVATSDSIDAANEATDAANAATDAANAAAEAADAATAAAQDAQAAVAALATEVAAMISGIKAQIIRLTNLVVKIQKKVKA